MRYLGNKTKLTNFIEDVMIKYNIQGETFADLFSGSGSVGDYFKDKYTIISNDYMYHASVFARAKNSHASQPLYEKFKAKYEINPFDYLNSREYTPKENFYIYNNYTPVGNRMYFTEENAIKIDGMRIEIEEFYKEEVIDSNEYYYLLGSLLESVLKVSNTTGTYQAFLKFWESRALKDFEILPLEMNRSLSVSKDNEFYNSDTNKLVREISGDIAYLDPPYTITQYANSYHMLETIAKYDNPVIFGKTGRRKKRKLSNYSNKTKAYYEFEDLLRQIDFEHVLISYSNQSILSLEEIVDLASRFAVDNKVNVESNEYREYATNNVSHKGKNGKLKECIIYFKKDREIIKSPLNFSGSKDKIATKIFKHLPKHVNVFIDAMGGAFNIGANVTALDKVIYNEKNPFVYEVIENILNKDRDKIISDVQDTISKFELKKEDKEKYTEFRRHYNEVEKTPHNLYVLHVYAFQNMIRFNNALEMNTPVGNNEFNETSIYRLKNFVPKTKNVIGYNLDYRELPIEEFDVEGTVFYFDPPYFITRAEYNDGKRGFEGWNSDLETELLHYLTNLDKAGFKFMLSNVTEHNGKKHHILIDWIKEHDYNLIPIGETGIKYPRKEILVTNYKV